MRRLHLQSIADAELAEAFEWDRTRSPKTARTFLAAVDTTLARVRETPEQFPVAKGQLRRALVPRFPYADFFVPSADVVRVVGIIHGKRHPRRWLRRG